MLFLCPKFLVDKNSIAGEVGRFGVRGFGVCLSPQTPYLKPWFSSKQIAAQITVAAVAGDKNDQS